MIKAHPRQSSSIHDRAVVVTQVRIRCTVFHLVHVAFQCAICITSPYHIHQTCEQYISSNGKQYLVTFSNYFVHKRLAEMGQGIGKIYLDTEPCITLYIYSCLLPAAVTQEKNSIFRKLADWFLPDYLWWRQRELVYRFVQDAPAFQIRRCFHTPTGSWYNLSLYNFFPSFSN